MRTLHAIAAVVLICGLAVTCDDAPESPARSTPPPPPPPPAPTLSRVELSGPSTFAPGTTADFTLIGVFSDGSRNDVSRDAQWLTNSASVAASLGQGRISGVARGDTTLTARYSNRSTSREIIVVPDGTFRVTGRITEEGVSPVVAAHVRVRDGADTGPETDTDASGFYRLYGVKPDTDFIVTRPGYAQTERRVTIDRHTTVNISMPLSGPRLSVAGTYTATFEFSACGSSFPNDLRRRVYTAVMKQAGADVEIRFTEPDFVHNSANKGDLMQGRVDTSGMSLFADSGYYYYYYGPAFSPSLIELLPGNNRLMTWGTSYLTMSGNRFSGALSGGATLSFKDTRSSRFIASCNAGTAVFERR